jgi:hypothetical protein
LLSVRSTLHGALITGEFLVMDRAEEIARFVLEITCDRLYPRSIPTVRETAGRVPVDLDRHVLRDGTFCLFHTEYYWQEGLYAKPLQAFLEGPLREFLLYQLCVEHGIGWKHGELAHGDVGALQFFEDELQTPRHVTIRMVMAMARGVTKHSACPCGSGRAIRYCHRECLGILGARGARARMRQLAARINAVTSRVRRCHRPCEIGGRDIHPSVAFPATWLSVPTGASKPER